MISKNSNPVQEIQSSLHRTCKGRVIRKEARAIVDSWRERSSEDFGFSECKSCGLILTSDTFFRGCPNCGSGDTGPVRD